MKPDIRKIKQTLRREAKEFRSGLTPDKKQRYARAILNRLTAQPCYKQCSLLLTYVSTPIEVDTLMLIERALADGKAVACPKCIDGTRLMRFYLIGSAKELEPGAFGVLEPVAGRAQPVDVGENSICIVPGLAFDRRGYRLGYGKGYYDRFLSSYSGTTVGICYAGCIHDRLPHGRYDRAVDILLTEGETRKLRAKRSPAAAAAAGQNMPDISRCRHSQGQQL